LISLVAICNSTSVILNRIIQSLMRISEQREKRGRELHRVFILFLFAFPRVEFLQIAILQTICHLANRLPYGKWSPDARFPCSKRSARLLPHGEVQTNVLYFLVIFASPLPPPPSLDLPPFTPCKLRQT
jgi:hypothetical protein